MNRVSEQKKAQISLFVILAIMIVVGTAAVIYIRTSPTRIPSELKPVEEQFLGCINNMAEEGIAILSQQGGYIELPKAEAGSAYMPFSSQMNFFGVDIPYWFYVSGNNLQRQQVPSETMMQNALAKYIAENIDSCNFDEFVASGYIIKTGDNPEVKTTIYAASVGIEVSYPLTITYGDVSKRVSKHSVRVNSDFGALYTLSKKIFDNEQKTLFLEQYTNDIITLNAPTTGAIISCGPKVWIKSSIETDIKTAIQDNTAKLKIKGSYYTLKNDENKYFVTDIGEEVSNAVSFFYSPLLPTKFDVEPSEEEFMKALPIGNQQGMGVLGFCYVPYHFVYSVSYPVLVQVYGKDGKSFQFPVVVIIDKNVPRKAEATATPAQNVAEVCQQKLGDITVYTSDTKGKPLPARIQYKCLSTVCDIGSTSINSYNEFSLKASFPQCINGYVLASADGYKIEKQELSTNEPAITELKLTPFYNLNIKPLKGGIAQLASDESVLINFISNDYSTSIIYPSQKQVKLAEGSYKIETYLFSNGNIKLSSESVSKCIKVPESGILGFFGTMKEECYDMNIPEQTLTQVITGGGSAEFSATENELEESSGIEISIPETAKPETAGDVQDNYILISGSSISARLI